MCRWIKAAGSILLSQGCIFWQLVLEQVCIAAQRNVKLVLQWKDLATTLTDGNNQDLTIDNTVRLIGRVALGQVCIQ